MAPLSPREVLVSSRGVFTVLSPEAFSFLLGVLHSPDPQTPSPVVRLQVELSDGTAHTITDDYAGKEDIIQVAAKDNEIGTWSDWSVAAHATPWTEEPRHLTTEAQAPGEPAPALLPGSILLLPTPPGTWSLCPRGLHTLCGCHIPFGLSSPCCSWSLLSGHCW